MRKLTSQEVRTRLVRLKKFLDGCGLGKKFATVKFVQSTDLDRGGYNLDEVKIGFSELVIFSRDGDEAFVIRREQKLSTMTRRQGFRHLRRLLHVRLREIDHGVNRVV